MVYAIAQGLPVCFTPVYETQSVVGPIPLPAKTTRLKFDTARSVQDTGPL
jgi:ribosomal protein S10